MNEVLKQLVEALEHELCIDWTNDEEFNASAEKMHDAIQAGKQAIAELENQEPVATVTSETGNPDITMSWWHEPALTVGTKLYTYPPQRTWVGLTLDEIALLHANYPNPQGFALALQAKLKEKNT
jgi:hypothetical protein